MLNLLKNIWLGVVLIAAASAVLLLSDLNRRQTKDPHKKQDLPRLAIMQWTSTDLLDNTVSGMVQGLRQQGFEDGRTAVIRFFNASGDSATANMMARELTGALQASGSNCARLEAILGRYLVGTQAAE